MAEYISREAVNNLIEDMRNNRLLLVCERTNLYILKSKVAELPAAGVQPVKRGKWESSQRTIETGTVYCSNCAIEYYISDLQTVGDCNGIVHYCPNCGARMDGDSE